MPDPRFFLTKAPIEMAAALRAAGLDEGGKAGLLLTHAAPVMTAHDPGAVIFASGDELAAILHGRRFGVCFVEAGARAPLGGFDGALAPCPNPKAAFAAVAELLHEQRRIDDGGGAPKVSRDAKIHPTAVLGPDCEIGRGAEIGPNAVIGPGVVIGERTRIAANASVECALVGSDAAIGAASAIGGPGFGFAPGPGGLRRVPQLGRVIINDRVEIGAGTCIDRGALGDTIIGEGCKIDNLVQIAHNVRIGPNCVIAAQVGIAGSTIVGARAQFGGQAGIADHLTIGDDARIAAKAGVMRDVPAGETWGGYPARAMMTWMRETAALTRAAERKKKKATDHDD